MLIHIVYIEYGVFLSKKTYGSRRDIQDEFSDYKSSLGPWEAGEVVDYLEDNYSTLSPSAATQIAVLLDSDSLLVQVKFSDASSGAT